MSIRIDSLSVGFDKETANAARRSFNDLFRLAGSSRDASDCISGLFNERFVSGLDHSDLVGTEPFGNSASGAIKLEGFKLNPCDAYLMLFAAFARNADHRAIRIDHGWPSLRNNDEGE